MICPKCRNIKLERRSNKSQKDSGPLFCPGCAGIWVKNNELDKISEYSSVNSNEIKPSKTDTNPDSRTGLCPEGHGLMIRAKVHLEPHFYLEKCPHCGGIWFDKGELNQIIENNINDNLSVLWTLAWQRMQRQEKGREYYHNLHKELLGDDIYNSICDLADKLKDHPEQLRALGLLHQALKS